jgi:hypothetical protein
MSPQTMDIECVKYKKSKKAEQMFQALLEQVKKSIKIKWHSHYMINHPCKTFIQLQ